MIKQFRLLFFLSFFSFIGSGVSFFIIPFVRQDAHWFFNVVAYAASAVFWLGLCSGVFFFIKMNALGKKMERQLKKNNQLTLESFRCGIISFFRNKYAIVADSLMIISVILFVAVLIFEPESDMLSISVIVMFFLSFVSHSFFNGKSFIYILKYEGYRKKKMVALRNKHQKVNH